MSEKLRQKKAGARKDKKGQAARKDVPARQSKGAAAARPKTKTGAPKAQRAGKTKSKGGSGSPTHKDFSAAELERNERPVRGGQGRK